MRRGWKHPMYVDAYATLAAARRDYPHVTRFKRVIIGDLIVHPTLGIIRHVKEVRQ